MIGLILFLILLSLVFGGCIITSHIEVKKIRRKMYQDELWNYFINNSDKFVLEIPVLFKVYKIYTLEKFTAIVNTKRNTCAIFEGDDCILSAFNEKKSREMFNCLINKKE